MIGDRFRLDEALARGDGTLSRRPRWSREPPLGDRGTGRVRLSRRPVPGFPVEGIDAHDGQ
ncbi:hypothetical protein GCM10010345_66450 [Streptomyces canarius]|uniref:Uncharacterized protein n=1 Tax=Streptomyces canarius TaxID=285453 RepID=A0ABQ3D0H2_9ACTN|nr:hypothetical protein GCM10010345_66450 [Streptomyces canarius]